MWDLAGAGHVPAIGVVNRGANGAHAHSAGIVWIDGLKAVRAAVLFLRVEMNAGVGRPHPLSTLGAASAADLQAPLRQTQQGLRVCAAASK